MKKSFFLQLFVLLFLAIMFSRCTKVETENVGILKTTVLQHNYIAIVTEDNSPAEVEVYYSIWDSKGHNKVKTERLSTPCLIGGENVLVTYDSIIGTHSGKTVYTRLTLKREFQEKGADFLSIKNLSSAVLEYAVIGNQPLILHDPTDLQGYHNFTNLDDIEKNKVVKESPTPINSDGIPILYLLKPELSPMSRYYIMLSVGSCVNGELTSIESTYAQNIEIPQQRYTIRDIVNFYKKEYSHGNTLFADYSDYDSKCHKYRGLARLNINLYGEIQPNSLLQNFGQIWFINATLGIRGIDTFKMFK